MDAETARLMFAGARVARLATVGARGKPGLVPVTFAVEGAAEGDRIVTAVDHKPKRTGDLRRLRDIRDNPEVALLADHYEDDWTRLWWVRADGRAAVVADGPDRAAALDALARKYEQYRERRPAGPVIVVRVTRWSGWRYAG
ncbi:TIGR03668 family PPOX class F420-dependent oxidoreductase [Nonomuraea sp. MCN248]|uniref:TIGR03668 family PPOX class F420-dependent oxidoreductase n=1 Tax=Nonomuraea corallina TaxID=2989783 RepID=A0ABT4S4E5_9ACTN|nr:TIGR03668 family PPOX class F420-dependent oxidoreductase [Nonomuraea corallina]MDA0631895.1 TIGR03668 family PPOX class F420-dependent oxidoreductase [Nonomuraea corallina]